MRDVFIRELTALAEKRSDIFLITADLGFGVLDDFARRFPRQFLNVGVAEQNMTAVATGIALEGATVFTYSLGNFPTLRCLEQIRNDACYHQANVKIVSVGGGMSYGAVGPSHHATEDLASLRPLPGITIVAPGERWEAGEAVREIASKPGVAYLRLDKTFAAPSHAVGERFEIGRARKVADGDAVTIVATGGILGEAMRAAEILRAKGAPARVLSCHTVKPLDREAVAAAARETGGMVVVEEHSIDGGLGGAVAEALIEAAEPPRFFERIGLRSFSSAVGSQKYLRSFYGIDAGSIVEKVLRRLDVKQRMREVA